LSLTPAKIQETLNSKDLSVFFSPQSVNALSLFTQKMLHINETLNLTRWVEDEQVLTFHMLDSALALPLLKSLVTDQGRWMDMGTGCGFPGVVLVAAFPQAQVELLDSVGKKTNAIEECLLAAGMKAKTLTGRAEEAGRDPGYREQYEGIVARAVADLRVLLEYAIPLLKTGGYLVNWMTEDQVSRLNEAKKAFQLLDAKIIQTVDYFLPGSTQKRYYVVIQKNGPTSDTYPRGIGQPSKQPL
jgi:16S rRNA (guanine527-N7)-methyltransferase